MFCGMASAGAENDKDVLTNLKSFTFFDNKEKYRYSI